MGGHVVEATFDGALSPSDLQKKFREYQDQLTVEYGTDGYNGTFSTCRGLTIDMDGTFASREEAVEYALGRAYKWGPAVAVKARDRKVTRSEYLFNGKRNPYAVGPVKSHYLGNLRTGVTQQMDAADQLTASEKTKAVALYTSMKDTEATYRQTAAALSAHVATVTHDLTRPIPTGWTTQLRALRKAQVKTEKAKVRAAEQYTAFAEAMDAKYLTTTIEELPEVWVVAGIAAS